MILLVQNRAANHLVSFLVLYVRRDYSQRNGETEHHACLLTGAVRCRQATGWAIPKWPVTSHLATWEVKYDLMHQDHQITKNFKNKELTQLIICLHFSKEVFRQFSSCLHPSKLRFVVWRKIAGNWSPCSLYVTSLPHKKFSFALLPKIPNCQMHCFVESTFPTELCSLSQQSTAQIAGFSSWHVYSRKKRLRFWDWN